MVSLSTGMRPCADLVHLARILDLRLAPDGFFASKEWFRYPHDSTREGVFIAGCASGVKPIRNCIIDGSATASRVAGLLRMRPAAAARAS
jgi:heterodisulfide reductase subunit A